MCAGCAKTQPPSKDLVLRANPIASAASRRQLLIGRFTGDAFPNDPGPLVKPNDLCEGSIPPGLFDSIGYGDAAMILPVIESGSDRRARQARDPHPCPTAFPFPRISHPGNPRQHKLVFHIPHGASDPFNYFAVLFAGLAEPPRLASQVRNLRYCSEVP